MAAALHMSALTQRAARLSAPSPRASLAMDSSASQSAKAPSSLLARLNQLQSKAKKAADAAAERATTAVNDEPPSFIFSEHRARLQLWWADHLESKAAMVQAAAPDLEEDKRDDADVFLKRPVLLSVGWRTEQPHTAPY